MFFVKTANEDGFDKIILEDKNSKTTAEIIADCGAILHAFTVNNNNQLINVIDGYQSKNDFKDNLTTKGFKGCKLSPFVCRLSNGEYHFNNKNFKVDSFYLDKHAIHGILYAEVFNKIKTWSDEKSAGVLLEYNYQATDKGFPFKFTCHISYELKSKSTLTITTTVINNEKIAIPIQDGWHPYFTFGGNINNLQLQFKSKDVLEFDNSLLPTGKKNPYTEFESSKIIGETFFDNCFTLNEKATQPLCILKDISKNIQVEICPEKNYPYLQIYTPPHRTSIAIENLSGAPDAFNNKMGLIMLQPEASIDFTTTYKISSLS